MAAAVVAGCQPINRNPPPQVRAGDPAAGAQDIAHFGCGGCHVVPGVQGADGTVGPPLNGFARRQFIAGQVTNNPAHLIHWLRFPTEIDPGTDMPNLGITQAQARDIAAYLYTLD
jgi:cytochrome c2